MPTSGPLAKAGSEGKAKGAPVGLFHDARAMNCGLHAPVRLWAVAMQALSFPYASLLVALGGAAGSWLRYLVGHATMALTGPVRAAEFPFATLACNVAGSFAMGLLAGWLTRHGTGGEGLRLLLGVGVLGGFTTFSAFSLEFALLIERGAIGLAAGYVAISLAAGFAGLFAGLWLMRGIA